MLEITTNQPAYIIPPPLLDPPTNLWTPTLQSNYHRQSIYYYIYTITHPAAAAPPDSGAEPPPTPPPPPPPDHKQMKVNKSQYINQYSRNYRIQFITPRSDQPNQSTHPPPGRSPSFPRLRRRGGRPQQRQQRGRDQRQARERHEQEDEVLCAERHQTFFCWGMGLWMPGWVGLGGLGGLGWG